MRIELTSFIQDRIPAPSAAKIIDRTSGATKLREDPAVGDELDKRTETAWGEKERLETLQPMGSAVDKIPEPSDFYSQVLALLAKQNNHDVNLLTEKFPDELQRLVI